MNKTWPTNEQIEKHVFNDQEIDSMKDFNYYARSSLIMNEITKQDYLSIEKIKVNLTLEMSFLSDNAKDILKEIVLGL